MTRRGLLKKVLFAPLALLGIKPKKEPEVEAAWFVCENTSWEKMEVNVELPPKVQLLFYREK
jgi:hypothetical protein